MNLLETDSVLNIIHASEFDCHAEPLLSSIDSIITIAHNSVLDEEGDSGDF